MVISEVLAVFLHFGSFPFGVVCQSLVLGLACIHPGIVLVVELCLHTVDHLLNTLSWNRFGFYVFPFSNSRWWNWLVCISELFWGLNYVFILFNHPLNTLSWNRFGFYVFPFSNSWCWNWLVCISELFWGLNYVFILVNHLLNAIAWLLSLSIFSCFRSNLIS